MLQSNTKDEPAPAGSEPAPTGEQPAPTGEQPAPTGEQPETKAPRAPLHRTQEEADVFADRAVEWTRNNFDPVVVRLREYGATVSRGPTHVAVVLLRDHDSQIEALARLTFGHVVQGMVLQTGLTAMAGKLGSAACKTCEVARDGNDKIRIGFSLIALFCDATKAAEITVKHGDRPEKKDGGVQVTPSYELRPVDGKFLTDAALYGSAGMPTFVTSIPQDWQGQRGPTIEQQNGMVHSADKPMKGVTPENAPEFFEAMNGAKRAGFRVNQTTRKLVSGYDPAKAFAWLLPRYLVQVRGAETDYSWLLAHYMTIARDAVPVFDWFLSHWLVEQQHKKTAERMARETAAL